MVQYSEKNIISILNQAGIELSEERFSEFYYRFELAAEKRRTQKIFSANPTAKMKYKEFSAISEAAQELLIKLGVDESDHVKSIPEARRNQLQMNLAIKARSLGKTTHALLKEQIDGVIQIKRDSKKIAIEEKEREEKRRILSEKPNPRRSRTRHLISWINELSDIYREFVDETHVKPTITWNVYDERPEGHFLNFLHTAEIIFSDENISKQALADHIKKLVKG